MASSPSSEADSRADRTADRDAGRTGSHGGGGAKRVTARMTAKPSCNTMTDLPEGSSALLRNDVHVDARQGGVEGGGMASVSDAPTLNLMEEKRTTANENCGCYLTLTGMVIR